MTRPSAPSASALVELLIERPVAGGDMLARHDGGIVFVRGVIPGERVRARIVRAAKGVAWAELIDVLDPSPDRRPGGVDPNCGGLDFVHMAPARQRALKADIIVDAFRRIGKRPLVEPPAVWPSPEYGYRLRARLHVRHGQAGFFRENTHQLCDAGPSRQLRDDSLAAVAAVVIALGPAAGDCDAVTLSEDLAGHARVLHLDPRPGASPDPFQGRIQGLDGLTGVTGVTTIASGRLVTLAGAPAVSDTAADLLGPSSAIAGETRWTRRPMSFFQGNRFLLGALLTEVLWVSSGEVLADLYAGVGLFAVALAARGTRVLAVEGDASSSEDLRTNAEQVAGRLTTVESTVEQALAGPAPGGLDSVVLDPPRTGMSAEAVGGLLTWQPRRVVYVSCDPPTLARDAALLYAGGYGLEQIEAFDLFPNTPHVETVAVFDRQRV